MRRGFHARGKGAAQPFDFVVLKGCRRATESDQPDYTGNLENLQAVNHYNSHKRIAGKQWHPYVVISITPAMSCPVKGKESFDLPGMQLL